MIWKKRKKKIFNQNSKKNKESKKKTKDSLSIFWDNFQRINIWTIEVPEGEQKPQKIKNLPEKIMKENFPNLVKKQTRK